MNSDQILIAQLHNSIGMTNSEYEDVDFTNYELGIDITDITNENEVLRQASLDALDIAQV